MKQVKRILRENTTVDTQTGEVLQRETTVQFSKEPAYVKLYFDCLGTYIKNDGLSESCNDLLVEVLKRTSYAEDGQVVHLDSYTREQICKATHKSLARLKQAITTWTKNKVLIRVARGVYQVNPYIFGRGEWRDIANLRATFNFSKGSVTVTREYEEGHREARIDIETGTCITNPNPSQTHENALEGASDVKQVSEYPYPTQQGSESECERTITSQQNLKRREAAFLLGATAFRTREMQKCASPFVEVRCQIEFLARETPNCTLPRTYTHIPSMDMRERERFASQGAKRRGEEHNTPA